ncbi:MAG: hypothetical protein KME29_04700 [Calothrix sp. FI2-JRJ7]|jgi:hypothetical protein|nr:hypothetical protein [Calothrix sp. FI2-JRJ7]
MLDQLALRSDILTAIENELGTYKFPDGATDKAICILPDPDRGFNYPEQGTKVTGLECVIKKPIPDVAALLGGGATKTYCWEIHLKQWDANKSLMGACDLLINGLSQKYLIERTSYMPIYEKLATIEQCKIFLKDFETRI